MPAAISVYLLAIACFIYFAWCWMYPIHPK